MLSSTYSDQHILGNGINSAFELSCYCYCHCYFHVALQTNSCKKAQFYATLSIFPLSVVFFVMVVYTRHKSVG